MEGGEGECVERDGGECGAVRGRSDLTGHAQGHARAVVTTTCAPFLCVWCMGACVRLYNVWMSVAYVCKGWYGLRTRRGVVMIM